MKFKLDVEPLISLILKLKQKISRFWLRQNEVEINARVFLHYRISNSCEYM